jgi:hypothetical protein
MISEEIWFENKWGKLKIDSAISKAKINTFFNNIIIHEKYFILSCTCFCTNFAITVKTI